MDKLGRTIADNVSQVVDGGFCRRSTTLTRVSLVRVAWCDPPIFKKRQHLSVILQFVALKYAIKLWILWIFALFLSFEDPMCVNLLCC